MRSDKLLIEKYHSILVKENNDTASLIAKVNGLIDTQSNNPMESNELSTAFNALLLSLLDSSDVNVKRAAANTLNSKKPQVAKEEDEPIGNQNSNTTGVTSTGF